jgi:cellulose/xylan binding protein with CBM9 domain/uncharacterized protein DUF5916
MMCHPSAFLTLSLVSLFLLPAVRAGDARLVTVLPLDGDVRVDGVLDDAVWQEGATIGELLQADPHPGEPSTESTDVWVAYDSETLYVAIHCLDSEPKTILATEMSRDARLFYDDSVEILLDTYHDRRNAYYFSTNPAGALVDGRITENRYPDTNWDGIWNVKTRTDETGWTAEFQIPFKTLSFDPHSDTWGFNVARTLARKREESRWASPSLDFHFTQVAMAGSIDGLQGLKQGIGLDIKPYGLLGYRRDLEYPDKTGIVADAGVDIFYRVTGNLISSTTINTDFAETEADTRQVNLTRFPLFFPEKRDFFLEDAGIFEFGIRSSRGYSRRAPDIVPFFSRRIGMVDGEEVPILFGQKITGKVGRVDVGVLDVMTRDSDIAPGRNFFVARTKANFWSQSYVGALVTHGEPTGETSNSVGGVDLKLATSDFLKRSKNFQLTMFGSKSSTPDVKSRDTAFGGEVSYPNDLLYTRYRWQKIGENYNPALGFVRRKGVRISSGMVSLSPRPEIWNIRQLGFMFYFTTYHNLVHDALETREMSIRPLEIEFNGGERFEYRIRPAFERLFEPFEIRDEISIPVGDYNFTSHEISYRSASNKRLRYDAEYQFGSFYTGNSDQLAMEVSWQNSHISTSVGLEQYWVRLKEGDFDTRLALFRFDYSFNPLMTLSNFVQYDTDSQNIGLQSRLRWIIKPGNEVYLVLNQGWQESIMDRFEVLRTDVRAKVNYTFRF